MAGQFPESALSREQKPWGREVEDRIAQLEQALSRALGENTNANKGQNSTIDVVVAQIDDIQTAVAGAATAQSVADLAYATRLSPAVSSGSASAFSVSAAGVTLITLNIPVPTGFTRALVFAAGYVATLTNASFDELRGACVINGTSGPTSRGYSNPNYQASSTAPSAALTLAGLSPGGTFPVRLDASWQTGPGIASAFSNATLTVMVVFLP